MYLNPFQSLSLKSTTPKVLLSLHDHLSNAISHQHLSCFCFLDISAVFDTLDQTILHRCLSSWLGLPLLLSWLTSYLSSRTSAAAISPHLFPSSPLNCEVPQGSVLGLILFNHYTPSSQISYSAVSHYYMSITNNFLYPPTPKSFGKSSLIYSQHFLLFRPGCLLTTLL